MLADGIGHAGAGILGQQINPCQHLFQKGISVGACQLVCALRHDELRRKVGAHAGGIDHTAARCHNLVKSIVDIDGAQRIAAQDPLSIAHVGAQACNVQKSFHLAALSGVAGQRKAALPVRNIAAECFGFMTGLAQISHGLFQFGCCAADQNCIVPGFADKLGRGKAHAAAAARDNTNFFHVMIPLYRLSSAASKPCRALSGRPSIGPIWAKVMP